MTIVYRDGVALDAAAAIDLFARSTLAERRPVHRAEVIGEMFRRADLVITAWDGELLVGVSRTLTDFSYVAYLADLAVDEAYQRQGIGRQLVEQTRRHLKPECMIVLLAAPAANAYYAKLGFAHNPRRWVLQGRL